jgi:hypothetical protein
MTRVAFATLITLGFACAAAADEPSALKGFSAPLTFKEVDKNGDGRINQEESAVISAVVEGFDFASADLNGDRVLNRQEFAAVMAQHTDHSPLAIAQTVTFEEADLNQDGRIDREEAARIPGFDFAAADSDNDRQLTRAEFRTAVLEGIPRG